MYTYIHMYVNIYVYKYIYYITLHYIALHCITLHDITYITLHTYVRTYIHTYIQTYIHVYIYIHIYICIYIYISTQGLVLFSIRCACEVHRASVWQLQLCIQKFETASMWLSKALISDDIKLQLQDVAKNSFPDNGRVLDRESLRGKQTSSNVDTAINSRTRSFFHPLCL